MRGERPKIKKEDLVHAPEDFVKIMKICWDIDPKKRPTFDELFVQLKDALILCEKDMVEKPFVFYKIDTEGTPY